MVNLSQGMMCGRNLPLSIVSSVIFNTAIAGLLTVISPWDDFWHNFVYSQCIGLSIFAINIFFMSRMQPGPRRLAVFSVTLPVSVAVGLSLAFYVSGTGSWSDAHVYQPILIGLFFGGFGSITYFLSERIRVLDAEVKQRRLNEVEREKREVEAHLRLLQAQIEPHFLFNTLANVSSLIEVDAAQARRLLDRLNDWLRVALARTRSEHATLGDELVMLENYLKILTIRFCARLRWRIEADEETRQLPFPPMLLQPLVENAIRHGIEPKLGGGRMDIVATIANGKLRLQVTDDGVGFRDTAPGGAGLDNVRARLKALFGAAGRLELLSNAAGGVSAVLELPR
ncbi:MAG TPA: histidine kinase [Gallionella sp.]|nr:histidine kinase [Gallionella sp.]